MAIIQFPKDFLWGAATASYQVEGAANEDGRKPSIWDTFSRTPGKIKNGDHGDVACDSYHRYEEDIEIMADLGINVYRFSVAWPRVIPDGVGEVNERGLDFYRRFIDKLLDAGIEPILTLYHWDLPQALHDQGGWANRATVDAFVKYAEVLFKEFDGKVKYWLTINEPWCVSFLSNFIGEHAPGNRDLNLALQISHHLLLAHGKTVQRFREIGISGKIGYAPNVEWKEPFSNRKEDIEASRREVGFLLDWFFDPVFKGQYPKFLVDWFNEKGGTFEIKEGDMEIINERIDFLGINFYTGSYSRYKKGHGFFDSENVDIGFAKTDINWNIFPDGFYKVLLEIKNKYGDIPIVITENGACYNNEPEFGRVKDTGRIKYFQSHLASLRRAMDSGVNIKGYCVWSLLDNFEWAHGYSMRFGIVHVDFRTLDRTKKDSFYWYKQLIRNGWYEY
ncbi:GH1 family beta-glucosidase [Fervidibacillus albus]|uniref:Beta-glucosidase n=1 Tax=Fervidibacillus albus TaxID=2980026 RepID=A0A9E8RW43_9BACI|nr:GH1 family beta-glucosidase [Fervidibacillus albus]WAA11340.1 GH1 family beta-glucosidase [Fervidibacillus albus]